MISTMNKLELLATSLALGGCTLLSRSVPTEVRPILTPPIPTSEQVLRHFTDLNIQVLRGSDVNLEEQSLLELSKAYNSFLTASQKGELSYITSDPNNPLKTGALTESVAGALNIDAKNLPDGAINYALLPTEIKFGNQASVFYQPVLINAIDPSTGNQYQKVVMFGSSDGQNWGLVSFTQGSVNILSSQNAGVIIEGTNTVYTSFDKGSPPQITSILIAGGENGALFQSAMYVRGNNGEFELVLRDQEGTESGPLTNSDGLFEVSPPTDNQSPTPSPFKFDVSLVNYKIKSPPKIETPTPTATATTTPTPTEVPPPAEFLAQIPADKQYEIANGQVLVDGQVWFEINSAGEWQKVQRTITFDLEGGGTIEMFEFDTVEEAFQYIVVKDGATWLDKFDPYWEGKTPEDSAFWKIIKTIPERDFLMGVGLLESPKSQRTLWIDLYGMGDGTMILYRTDEGNLNIIFVDENATELKPRMIKVDFLATMFPPTPQP